MNKKVFHFNLRLSLSVLVALGLLLVLQSCERDDFDRVGMRSLRFKVTTEDSAVGWAATRSVTDTVGTFHMGNGDDFILTCTVSDTPFETEEPSYATRGVMMTTGGLETAGEFVLDGYDGEVSFSGQPVDYTGSGEEWKVPFVGPDSIYWSSKTAGMSIFGWYPGKGNLSNIAYNLSGGAEFDYAGPSTDASGQQDLIYTSYGPKTVTEIRDVEEIPLEFRHALACVRFQVGTMFKGLTVKSVEMKNVYPNGHCVVTGGAAPLFAWTPSGTKTTMAQTFNYTTTVPYLDPAPNPNPNPLLGNGSYFYFVPQSTSGITAKFYYKYDRTNYPEDTPLGSAGFDIIVTPVDTYTDDIPLGVVDWKAGKYYTYQLKKIRQPGEGVPYSGYSGASDHLGQFSFDSKMGAEFPITNFDVTGIEYVKVTWDHDLTNHPGKNISPFVYLRDPSNHSLRTVTTIATSGVPQPSASDSYVYDGTTYYGVWTPADPTKSETARREYIFYLGGKYKTVEIVFGFDNAYTGGKSATWTVEKFPEFLVLDPSKGSKHPS